MIELAIPTLPKQALHLAERNRNSFDYKNAFTKFSTFGNNLLRIKLATFDVEKQVKKSLVSKLNAIMLDQNERILNFVTNYAPNEAQHVLDGLIVQYNSVDENRLVQTVSGVKIKIVKQLEKQKKYLLKSPHQTGVYSVLSRTNDAINLIPELIGRVKESPKKLTLVVSALPEDIVAVSTGRKWVSCTSLDKCEPKETNLKRVQDILESGAIVAYLVPTDDYEIDEPEWRQTIYRLERGNNFVFVPAHTSYSSQLFKQILLSSISERTDKHFSVIIKNHISKFCDKFNRNAPRFTLNVDELRNYEDLETPIIENELGINEFYNAKGHTPTTIKDFIIYTLETNKMSPMKEKTKNEFIKAFNMDLEKAKKFADVHTNNKLSAFFTALYVAYRIAIGGIPAEKIRLNSFHGRNRKETYLVTSIIKSILKLTNPRSASLSTFLAHIARNSEQIDWIRTNLMDSSLYNAQEFNETLIKLQNKRQPDLFARGKTLNAKKFKDFTLDFFTKKVHTPAIKKYRTEIIAWVSNFELRQPDYLKNDDKILLFFAELSTLLYPHSYISRNAQARYEDFRAGTTLPDAQGVENILTALPIVSSGTSKLPLEKVDALFTKLSVAPYFPYLKNPSLFFLMLNYLITKNKKLIDDNKLSISPRDIYTFIEDLGV